MYSSSFRLTNRDIDLALEAGHLFLVFQPKIELATGRTLGAEAYVRWNHPDYGLMPPGLFLSFFERRGRSVDLTRSVVATAADAMVQWRLQRQHWPVSINLSGSDLGDATLPGTLAALVGERGLDTSDFTLEVPEGVFARNADDSARIICEFRRLGFRTALDGGGAVVVPAEYVTPDYFSEVKISGAAIIRFAHRLRHAGLGFIGRRVSLAASLGLDATAVGVEDETTLSALASLGFTAAQGAHICRPREAKELIGWSFAQDMRSDFLAVDAPDDALLLEEPMEDDDQEEALDRCHLPNEITLSYEDHDLAIPGIDDVPVCTGALDPACFFPGRNLIALMRRPPRHGRRLPGIDRPIRMRIRRPKQKPKGFLARALGL
ncbi:MAG: EAL domain-containing protein [Parvibaculum sp.]|uniref:EAL domain-containing protein n=1 Tax=Parvibaculum sp. TaxID=2024848 RepID=UPI003C7248A0